MNTPSRKLQVNQNYLTPKKDVIGVMPSPLIRSPKTPRYTPKPSSLNDLDDKFPALEETDEMLGKAGLVYLATSNPGQQRVAIKRQILHDPHNKQSTAYRELQIMQQLNKSIRGNHNFIKLLDWNKCWLESTPPRNSEKTQSIQCMNLVMKQAGKPLQSLIGKDKNVSLYLFKQVLFQILFSLAKAQENCEFMHNDLHLKNILIDLPTPSQTRKFHKYTANNTSWFVDSKIIVTIVDFGLSRITLDDGTIIHNGVHKIFLPSVDVEHLASQFSKFKITSWYDSFEQEKFSPEDEKEHKKQKRSLMQQMRKGIAPAALIRHAFFESMQQKPAEIIASPPKTPPRILSPCKNLPQPREMPLSPMSAILSQQSSCLPNISSIADSIQSIQQKVFRKVKAIPLPSKELSNKENIISNSISLLKKRKLRKRKPAPKRQRTK